jgi:mono/diheme cytochrome c family protein
MRINRYSLLLLILAGILLGWVLLRWQTRPSGKPVTITGITVPPVPLLSPEIVSHGETIYAQYCAGCHGANLEGVPNWKVVQSDGKLLPPPHDSSGHTWHHPDDLLLSIIAEGGDPSDSKMPAYSDILTESEMKAILAFIKSSWELDEREFQWWITTKAKIPQSGN